MASKRRLMIINKWQFGYHTDTYKYCLYLQDKFDIIYICYDQMWTKRFLKDIQVKYFHKTLFKIFDFILFLRYVSKSIATYHPDLIFLVYFPGCFFLRYLAKEYKIIFDIRTGSTKNNRLLRRIRDFILHFESLFFEYISIISVDLASNLNIKTFQVIPLGADQYSNKPKKFNALKLFYVGMIRRNLNNSVRGFKQFYDQHQDKIELNYTIVGRGRKKYVKMLQKDIEKFNLSNVVHYLGHMPDIHPFFESQNIGISFIPMTTYFDPQPPTKTFEYILSGMICIATATRANQNIIRDANGVLCKDDTAQSFCNALEKVYTNLGRYNSDEIAKSCTDFYWQRIIENIVAPYFLQVLENSEKFS